MKNAIARCLWYWAYFNLEHLSCVLNIRDLPHLEGLSREDAPVSDFRRSLEYLISITPPPPRYSPDPFLCTNEWTLFQAHLPMIGHIFQHQRRVEQFVGQFHLCIIL